MMTDDTSMLNAIPHIEKAIRSLEMLKLFAEGKYKKLSLDKHVKQYYDSLSQSVVALQATIVTDLEYTDGLKVGIDQISATREYSLAVTENNDGDVFYSLDAMLPLNRMKRHAMFVGRREGEHTIS